MGVSAAGYDLTPLNEAQVEEKAADLTSEERRVLLDHGTEHPFCGTLLDNKKSRCLPLPALRPAFVRLGLEV